jgi:hypothetical protein
LVPYSSPGWCSIRLTFCFGVGSRRFVGFEFYKVVAAATMSVMSHLMITYLTSGAMNASSPTNLIYIMPGLLMLSFVTGFVLFKIPTMTASLFSGHVGGHSTGLSGMVTALVARAL